jgi:hypothetical protein
VAARLASLQQKAVQARAQVAGLEATAMVTDGELVELKAAGTQALKDLPAALAGAVPEARQVLSRLLDGLRRSRPRRTSCPWK